jgi:thrombospondin type 3 repeat protein
MTPGGGHTAPARFSGATISPMARALAISLALALAALAAPAAAHADGYGAAHDMCGGAGGGGSEFRAQDASIPPPPYDPDCDLVGDGPNDPDGSGPVRPGPDNCPTVRNGDQTDTDGDGQGDACDADDDADGVPDTSDNCRTKANPDQRDDDHNGIGDDCQVDSDGDGHFDPLDNCPTIANPDQANSDFDKQGDACDFDDDDDYIPDASDNCPLASNQDQVNTDNDALGDACDPTPGIVTGPTGPGGTENDHSKPRVRVRLARVQRLSDLLGGMATAVRCSEACAISGQLMRGRRALVAKGTATLAGAGRTWLFVRLKRGMARRLFDHRARVRATLRLKVTDAAGNVTRARRTVILAA